jgi:predicted neuraminidase
MTIQTKQQIFPLATPPTPECHAATVVQFEGTLYAAWFGGTKEGRDDVGIWLSKREGGIWSKPACMACGDTPHWNPVLFTHSDSLFLYFKRGKKIPSWYTCFRVLKNGAWSEPSTLVPGDLGGRGPVKNKPILLNNGTICAPASLEFEGKPANGQQWQAFVDLSKDGLNWQAQKPIPAEVHLIQPTLWESSAGLHALLRSNAGAIYRSDSMDGGRTWCKAYATTLPNNNSGIDAVYFDGRLYVIYNPVSKNWGPRTPLVVSMSEDNGASWSETVTLEDAPGGYAYPAVIAVDGALHIVYTHKRKGIVYAMLTID